jgi:hypothetical protein
MAGGEGTRLRPLTSNQPKPMVPIVGKGATWLLYLAIGCRIVTHDHTSWPLWLFWFGVGAAVVAALLYVRDALREVRR